LCFLVSLVVCLRLTPCPVLTFCSTGRGGTAAQCFISVARAGYQSVRQHMKRHLIFFLVGAASTSLLAFACSKMSYYLLTQWKTEGGYFPEHVGFALEHATQFLVFPASLILPSPTQSPTVVLTVLAINFSFWGMLAVAIGYCLTSRSRRTR